MCGRKYFYSYIERRPQDKGQWAVLGSSIHKTIEKLHNDPPLRSTKLEVFLTCYNEEVIKNELMPDVKMIKDGAKMLEIYDFDRRTPHTLEMEFVLPFPNEAHAVCYINGYLDQVYSEGFVDLKSNGRKPLQLVLDNDLQFIIYDWAFKELYNYTPKDRIWNHLRTGEDLNADVGGKQDLAQREIEKILDSEITGIYDKHVGDWCRYCSFQEPCLGRKY